MNDKPTQTGNSLEQEQIIEKIYEKDVPDKVKAHSYNLRSNVEFACAETQEKLCTYFQGSWYGVSTATNDPEPKEFDKGLIFVKDTDVLLSGDQWTTVVNIALDDYTNVVDLLKSMLQSIRNRIQDYKNPKFYSFDIQWDELARLDLTVKDLERESQSFQKLLYEETLIRILDIISARNKRLI